MNCFGIEIRRRPRIDPVGVRKAGIESDPQVYPLQRPRFPSGSGRRRAAVSVSHPGFTSTTESSYSVDDQQPQQLRVFTLQELRSATKGFDFKNLIGEGGFGHVYKGTIKQRSKFHDSEEKLEVAIKQLNTAGLQGHNEWVTEVHFLSLVDNPFLVKLVGYCADDDERGIQRLLVYEYMTNRGLDDHIFRDVPPVVPWDVRVKVALGAARGLAYLHDEKGVIFRDFKTANVLLDEEFNPKLSDFGLARQGPDAGKTHVTTGVKGTYGYAAPEYIQTGHLTFKSDVFSFGVVLLEILTGRRTMDRNRPRVEQRLLEWVKPFINDPRKFHHAVDARLESRYPLKAAMKFATIAIQCLAKQPKERPKMVDVVEGLKKVLEMTYSWETPTAASDNSSSRSPARAAAADTLRSPRRATSSSNPPAFPLSALVATRRSSAASPGLIHVEEPPRQSSPLSSSPLWRRQARDIPSLAMERDIQMPAALSCAAETSIVRKNHARSAVRNDQNRYLSPPV